MLSERPRDRLPVFGDDLNDANDVVVKVSKIIGRDPRLKNRPTSSLLNLVTGQEFFTNLETGYVTDAARLHVPITRYARRVLLVEYRIKDRLPRKARWPRPPTRRLDQSQLLGPGWTPQSYGLLDGHARSIHHRRARSTVRLRTAAVRGILDVGGVRLRGERVPVLRADKPLPTGGHRLPQGERFRGAARRRVGRGEVGPLSERIRVLRAENPLPISEQRLPQGDRSCGSPRRPVRGGQVGPPADLPGCYANAERVTRTPAWRRCTTARLQKLASGHIRPPGAAG